MDIQVGEYIRTINGEIGIFKGYNANSKSQWKHRIEFQKIKTWKYCADGYILKHSENLIDLIEVGDVIQLQGEEKLKYEVLKISWSESKGKHIHIINPFRTEGGKDIFIEDIKSIVTKEMMESVEYRVN